jgi:hypothetical protein
MFLVVNDTEDVLVMLNVLKYDLSKLSDVLDDSITDRSLYIVLVNDTDVVSTTDNNFTHTGVATSDTTLVETFESVLYNDFNIEIVVTNVPVADSATYTFLVNDATDDSIVESIL